MKTLIILLSLCWGFSAFSQKEGVFICGTGLWEDSTKIGVPDSSVVDGQVVYSTTDEPAEFVGGYAALKKYILEKISYPSCREEYDGKVYLRMIIQKDGSISNVSVLRGAPDCPECDKEAVRVIKSMPNWVPAKVNGQPVNSYFNLPVRFRF
jgi:protein TonB